MSHDSYFRLLVNARPSGTSNGQPRRLDEEDDNLEEEEEEEAEEANGGGDYDYDNDDDRPSSLLNQVIYAEISKNATKSKHLLNRIFPTTIGLFRVFFC